MKHNTKRGQIDVQFNWIFVLLIGALILSFFVGVAMWYKGTQEQKITGEIVLQLESLMKTAQESPKTAMTTTIPDITLSFTCSPYDCSTFGCPSEFSGGGIARSTETQVLFSLASLEGTNLITWSLEWALPYKIANFLYVTTDAVRYIIVYDEAHSDVARVVNTLLAENSYITKETVKVDSPSAFSITNKNDAFVRIIAFLESNSLPTSTIEDALGAQDEGTWDIVYVDGDEDSGEITFSDGAAEYVGLPLLVGALFSANKDFYSCNVQKALYQAAFVGAVYRARTAQLHDAFSTDSELSYCTYYFESDIQTAIETIPDALDPENTDIVAVRDAVTTLEENNKYAQIKGCPRVY